MKRLIVLGIIAISGLMVSSCCNNYDCLIDKFSKSQDPKEMAEIKIKIDELNESGKTMTDEQNERLYKAINKDISYDLYKEYKEAYRNLRKNRKK